MKKLIAMVAVAAGLMLGSAANAAQVDIFLTQSSATDWALTVNNNGGIGVGAVNFLTTGLTTMVTNPLNTQIDALSSVLSIDPLGLGFDFVGINNVAGQSIAAAGALNVLLATLSGPGPVTAFGSDHPDVGSDTVFDLNGVAIASFSITVVPTPPVPEPATTVLFGLGLAALALVRRSA